MLALVNDCFTHFFPFLNPSVMLSLMDYNNGYHSRPIATYVDSDPSYFFSALTFKASLVDSFADLLRCKALIDSNCSNSYSILSKLSSNIFPLLLFKFPNNIRSELIIKSLINLAMSCIDLISSTNSFENSPLISSILPHLCIWLLHLRPSSDISSFIENFNFVLFNKCSNVFLHINASDYENSLQILSTGINQEYSLDANDDNADFIKFSEDRMIAISSTILVLININKSFFKVIAPNIFNFVISCCTSQNAHIERIGIKILSSIAGDIGNLFFSNCNDIIELLIISSKSTNPTTRQYGIVGLGNIAISDYFQIVINFVPKIICEINTHCTMEEKLKYPFVHDFAILSILKYLACFGSHVPNCASIFYTILSNLPLQFETSINKDAIFCLVEVLASRNSNEFLGSGYMNLPKILELCCEYFYNNQSSLELQNRCCLALQNLTNRNDLEMVARFLPSNSKAIPLLVSIGLRNN